MYVCEGEVTALLFLFFLFLLFCFLIWQLLLPLLFFFFRSNTNWCCFSCFLFYFYLYLFFASCSCFGHCLEPICKRRTAFRLGFYFICIRFGLSFSSSALVAIGATALCCRRRYLPAGEKRANQQKKMYKKISQTLSWHTRVAHFKVFIYYLSQNKNSTINSYLHQLLGNCKSTVSECIIDDFNSKFLTVINGEHTSSDLDFWNKTVL